MSLPPGIVNTPPGTPVITSIEPTYSPTQQITLRWTRPSDGGSTISGYIVTHATDPNFTDAKDSFVALNTYRVFTNPKQNTTYYFKVKAFNGLYGSYSNTASIWWPMVPGKPTPPNLTLILPNSIDVYFNDPYNGGLPITNRVVNYATDPAFTNAVWIGAATSPTRLAQLPFGKTYYVRTVFQNELGFGEWSEVTAMRINSGPVIYNDGSWKQTECYVYYNNAWRLAVPYLYTNGAWRNIHG